MLTHHRQVTIAAAGASFLASTPLAVVFRTESWLVHCLAVVLAVLGAALLTRALRAALWAQILGMLLALTALLSWRFGDGTALLGFVPTPGTVRGFADLSRMAASDVRDLAAPVPDTEGLLFTVAASIGLMAILIDVLAVGLRQPALAGLPMLLVYSVPVAVLPYEVSWAAFVFTAAGFLWLLAADQISRVHRWGRRLGDHGWDVGPGESSPLAAAGRRLGLVGILVAVLVPLAVPSPAGGLLTGLVTGAGWGGGPGASAGRVVDPVAMLRGNLTRPDVTPLLKVRTEDRNPGYLRLAVADYLTEERATPRPPANSRVVGNRRLPVPPPELENGVDRSRHRAEITVVDLRQGYLPSYQNTVQLELRDTARWYHDDNTSVTWSRNTTRPGLRYDVEYVRYHLTAAQLRDVEDPDPEDAEHLRYVQVPQNDVVGRLVDRLVEDETTMFDRVRAIHDYFSKDNGFAYSTTVGEGTSGSAVVDFLQEKRGFCQQYAVAMTWMLRTAQIPARVAIGFTRGVREADGFVIRNLDAHAWVEVWFGEYGWVPFDPTPSSSVYYDVPLPYAPNPYEPPEQPVTSSVETDSSAAPAPSVTEPARRQRDDGAQVGATGGSQPPTQWPYRLIGVLLVAALLSVPGANRVLLRRRRLRTAAGAQRPGGSAEAGWAAWQEITDTLTDLDVGNRAWETPRGVAHRLCAVRPPLIETATAEIDLLARAAERASYARQPLRSDGLVAAVSAVRAELAGTVPGWVRIRATLLPASVTTRWHVAVERRARRWWTRWRRWRGMADRWLWPRARAASQRQPARGYGGAGGYGSGAASATTGPVTAPR